MDKSHNSVWEALEALPKPVDFEQVKKSGYEATMAIGKNPSQWNDWFDTNGLEIVNRLNSI